MKYDLVTLECHSNWNSHYFYIYAPICLLELCLPIDLPNGTVDYFIPPVHGRYLTGTSAFLRCDEGFHLVGDPLASCFVDISSERSATWFESFSLVPSTPRCEGTRMRLLYILRVFNFDKFNKNSDH